MRNQKGAALIVVLTMLTASLMLGLSSMQSSLIDERLAGNYKAAAQAQMGAEQAASAGLGSIGSADWVSLSSLSSSDVTDLRWDDVKEKGDGECQAPLHCYYRYVVDGEDKYIVAMGRIGDGVAALSDLVIVEVEEAGGGIVSGVEAALACVQYEDRLCSFSPGNGKSGSSVDGTDRVVDGKTQGSHQPDVNPQGSDVAAILMANGGTVSEQQGDGNKSAVVGDEIYSSSSYDNYVGRLSETWEKAEERIALDIANALSVARSSSKPDYVYYAGPGEAVSPGSDEGVVVLEGGVLDLDGRDKFVGLVVISTAIDDDGNRIAGSISSGGTSTIVGAVLGEGFSYGGGGNPSIFYSSDAIADYVGWKGDEESVGVRDGFFVESWR
ncbi:pilus assembly PilX family protein [Halomonas salina]|uniref:pilus assembly PilX family protein n=1 Tax=Halomonas salina TaxID=42565 RepID=UPI0009E008E6|nr:PilX N-terminal domain-containing pilus assembly protein [Halomonas salina]